MLNPVERRTQSLMVGLNDSEREALAEAARRKSMPVATWVRMVAMEAAAKLAGEAGSHG